MAKILSDGIKRWKSDIIASIKIFVYDMKENSAIVNICKKLWFGLAIVLFVVAGLVAYNLIWTELEPKDKPVLLSGANNSIALGSDTLGFGIYNSTFETCAFIYTMCESPNNVFMEGSILNCKTELRSSNNPKCKSFLNSSYVLVNRVLVCNAPFEINETCIQRPIYPSITGYGTYNHSILLSRAGLTYIRFDSQYLLKDKESSEPGLYDKSYTLSNYRNVLLNVKSISEVEDKKITRVSLLITSLFALFTIFPAVYHLRNLWRNEK